MKNQLNAIPRLLVAAIFILNFSVVLAAENECVEFDFLYDLVNGTNQYSDERIEFCEDGKYLFYPAESNGRVESGDFDFDESKIIFVNGALAHWKVDEVADDNIYVIRYSDRFGARSFIKVIQPVTRSFLDCNPWPFCDWQI